MKTHSRNVDLKILIFLLLGIAFCAVHLNRTPSTVGDDEPLVSQYVQALPDLSDLATPESEGYYFVQPAPAEYPTYNIVTPMVCE